jgi:hypothetical protein
MQVYGFLSNTHYRFLMNSRLRSWRKQRFSANSTSELTPSVRVLVNCARYMYAAVRDHSGYKRTLHREQSQDAISSNPKRSWVFSKL